MSNTLVSGLLVAHSHRLEDLTAVAVQLMKTHPLAPLEEEIILVQSNGIAQWLKIELAKASGIASMLNLTLPARFVWKAYRTVLGEQIPKYSPFDKERLSWRIMRVLPKLITEYRKTGKQAFSALENYLLTRAIGGEEADTSNSNIDERKLYQLSNHIADLFDQYQNYRADWLDHWTQGYFYLSSAAEPVQEENYWQPLLWRAIVEDIGSDLFWTNRAELHRQFVAKAKHLNSNQPRLPKRLVIFGISSLPQQTLEVLDALKGCMQIMLCVHNPCKHYWANIVDGKEALHVALKNATKKRHQLKKGMLEETNDDELHLHAHPLLASWGKQGRDYIHLLDLYDETMDKLGAFPALKFELFDEHQPQNRLQQLQNDVLELRPIQETRVVWNVEHASEIKDDSIQFHICHSIQREIEVLHDQLLDAFERDPNLQPRDIMVMVPDVNTYAPHIDAVFGRFDFNDPRRISYTIADQGQRHQQPLLVALELLLNIEQSRVNQTDVLSLLAVPAVQQRFDLNEQELLQIQRWFDEAGARWGISTEQRALYGMPHEEKTNSWWFSLERMVFGYAMGRPESDTQRRWNEIEPYHEVGGLSADAVGKLGLFITTLNHWWDFAQGEYCYGDWSVGAQKLIEQMFKPEQDADINLVAQVQQQLSEIQQLVADSEFEATLTLATFRESWLSRIDQPNLNQRFLAGSANFATLMPMRAIPFKHIYVLGMNDDAYPRRQPAIDFDLMPSRYRPGDRSRRDDDRYLFLEALLSAREKFYVSWVGRSARDNSEWPPSVLVAQLREHLVKGWCPASVKAKDFLASLTTEHKLQPFHPDYLNNSTGLFTYASEWQAARSIDSNQQQAPLLKPWMPEQEQRLQLNLRSLVNFMREPAQPFFNQRLNTYFRTDETQAHDSETFSLNALHQWQLNSELLDKSMALFSKQLDHGSFSVLEDLQPLQETFDNIFARLEREGRLGAAVVSHAIQNSARERVSAQLIEVSKLLEGCKPLSDELLEFNCMVETDVNLSESESESGSANVAAVNVIIEDRATQLFKNSLGRVLQIHITASECKPKHRFLPYIKHLVLSAVLDKKPHLKNVTTYVVFRKGKAEAEIQSLVPVDACSARDALKMLLTMYVESFSRPTGAVGELALEWVDNYFKAISGKLKLGRKTLPALEPVEAEEEASRRLLDSVTDDETLSQKFPYASRVQNDFSLLSGDDHFHLIIRNLYAPMVRSENRQALLFELPEVEKDDTQGGAQ